MTQKQEQESGERELKFGKGLVICLVKFAEHSMKLATDIEVYKEMKEKSGKYFTESNAITMHFNGASDHLYEIEVPEKWKYTEIGRKVEDLREKGLEIGHGFTGKTYTIEDAEYLYNLTQEIALLIDKELGLS